VITEVIDPRPEILLKAADVIEARGWHQGDYVPGKRADDADLNTCPVCVLGAINVATGYLPDYYLIEEIGDERYNTALALADHLGLASQIVIGDELIYVVGDQWNDKVATSAEQVTAALRECAAQLQAGAE
jgi:hypothetical protein